MRLLNVDTYELEQFLGDEVPGYAILSHTWGDDEVTFEDIDPREKKLTALLGGRPAESKQGWRKIRFTCEQAKADKLQYAWVDTCCIDKRSSAELSEAINSMYRWYQESALCYVYLSDITSAGLSEKPIKRSRWFTRGWTLQELLAPSTIKFYDADWNCLGLKRSRWKFGQRMKHEERVLITTLASATGIDAEVFEGKKSIFNCSIACRMSWASHREVSRVEDTAYCLLGIFDVNMPLLYGEREKAFFRLQEAIMQNSPDTSILAWSCSNSSSSSLSCYPISDGASPLALSPVHFNDSRSIFAVPTESHDIFKPPEGSAMAVTPFGIRLHAPILEMKAKDGVVTVALLSCASYDHPQHCVAMIIGKPVSTDSENISNTFVRVCLDSGSERGGEKLHSVGTLLVPLNEAAHAKAQTICLMNSGVDFFFLERFHQQPSYCSYAVLVVPESVEQACNFQCCVIRPDNVQLEHLLDEVNGIPCKRTELLWTPGEELELELEFGVGEIWTVLLLKLEGWTAATYRAGKRTVLGRSDQVDFYRCAASLGDGTELTLTERDLAIFNHRYREIQVSILKSNGGTMYEMVDSD